MAFQKIKILITIFILNQNLSAMDSSLLFNLDELNKSSSSTEEYKISQTDENQDVKIQNYTKVSLIDVVLESVSNNYKIKAAREKVRRAKINLDDAYSGYKPTLDVEYGYGKNQISPGDDGPQTGTHKYVDENLKILLRQNIYAGGATQHKIRSLEKSLQVAKSRYELAIAQEIQNAVNAYFGVVFSSQSSVVTKKNMQMLRKILEIVTLRYELGAASIGDISSIKASVANAETKLSQTNLKLMEALRYYEYIAGEDFKYTLPFEYEYNIELEPLDELLKKGDENNLNIVSYLTTVQSEKYKLKASRSAFMPKVDLEVTQTRTFNKDIAKEEFYIQDTNQILLTLKYNLYNGDKDSNAIIANYSNIRELQYLIEEERRKVRWIISDIFQSLNTLEGTIGSIEQEVDSSEVMVDSYWEAFKNGEQDLQTLLIAQRQLNTAQVSLIESYQNRLNGYFKLLFETGELVSFFDLDPTKENFIDFTKSRYENRYYKNAQHEASFATAPVMELRADLSTVTKTQKSTESADSLKEILLFKDKFLDADDNNFTIFISSFDSMYDTFAFMREHDLTKQTFIVDMIEEERLQNAVAYGIYDDSKLAEIALDDMQKVQTKKYEVVSVLQIKELYKKFLDNLSELQQKEAPQQKEIVKTKIIKLVPKEPKPYFTDETFKQYFLKASEDAYTLNLATFTKLDDAIAFVKNEQIGDKTLMFRYGTNGEWIKVLYGVFSTYEEAQTELSSLSTWIKENYYPIVENIKDKQKLYIKYRDLELGRPSASLDEIEYIQLSEDVKEEVYDINTSTIKANQN